MRGVRMLLEITKPDLHLETAGIESTIIVFGGARIVEQSTAVEKLAQAEQRLSETPDASSLKRASRSMRNISWSCLVFMMQPGNSLH